MACPSAAGAALPNTQLAAVEDLSSLSIAELANLQITSVSRRPEPLGQAAAAIYVITNDDIRRSGATSIPEALRLAPNLQVARLGSDSYGISARGFNHQTGTANKLQVLIDGRSVYTPLFSGVFWDEQDLPLADIERIEVISGPGGTLWGANAVNGVINIITKTAADTQGAMATLRGGTLDQTATLRYGGKAGDNTNYRVYGMATKRGALERPSGASAGGDFTKLQGGFRADWRGQDDSITLQGDIFNGVGEDVPGQRQNTSSSGGDILARWNRQFGDGSGLQAQAYYSRTSRDVISGINASVDTYDLDAQYNFGIGAQQFVAGGGYRVTEDSFRPGPGTAFLNPARRTLSLGNMFLQDRIALDEDVALTLGIKLENNSYTGWEYLPDARLSWRVTDSDFLWGAVSRAVRTPARFDRDLFGPGFGGGPNFESANLTALEAGYRGGLTEAFSFSFSVFYNIYDQLRTVETSVPGPFPLVVANGMEGETYGAEAWATYSLTDWWRMSAGLSTLQKDLRLSPGSRDIFGIAFSGNDPEYQAQLRSRMNLGDAMELDVGLRAVDGLASPRVPGYVEADVRLGWHMTDALDLSVSGNNLLHARHVEFVNGSVAAQAIPRSATVELRWRY